MKKRFVILSSARSGTSLLTSTLGTHPSIVCHGEIFHTDPQWHILGNLADLPTEEKIAMQLQVNFLDLIFDQQKPVAGFKMWHVQNPAACDFLMADDSVFKIIFRRENLLAQFSSGQLAKSTGVWDISSESRNVNYEVPKLKFNPAAFTNFIKQQNEIFDLYKAQSRGPVLYLTYQQIANGHFNLPLHFLEVDEIDLEPQKRKMYSSDIISRYDDDQHVHIQNYLDSIECSHWATE